MLLAMLLAIHLAYLRFVLSIQAAWHWLSAACQWLSAACEWLSAAGHCLSTVGCRRCYKGMGAKGWDLPAHDAVSGAVDHAHTVLRQVRLTEVECADIVPVLAPWTMEKNVMACATRQSPCQRSNVCPADIVMADIVMAHSVVF